MGVVAHILSPPFNSSDKDFFNTQRLDAKAARQARKNQRQALREARRLAASEQLEAVEFTNAAEFNELDAAADVSSAQKFGEW